MNHWAKYILLPLLLLGIFSTVNGQIENAAHFSYRLEPAGDLKVGQEATLYIEALIDPGYHMYSAKQVKGMEMVAAFFELDKENSGLELMGKLDDQGTIETKYDDIWENDISLYHDKVVYIQKLKVTAPSGKLVGFLGYQVCDDSQCIPGSFDIEQTFTATEKKTAPEPKPEPKQVPPPKEEAPKQQVQTAAPAPTPPAERQQAPIPSPIPSTAQAPQEAPQGPGMVDAVDWETRFSIEGEPQQGETLILTVEATQIDSGYYIYSSIPPKKPAGLPTTFNLNGKSRSVELLGELKEIGNPIQKYDETFETDVIVFEKTVTFSQEIRITGDNPILDSYLSYQVCDDSKCVLERVEVFEDWGNKPTKAPVGTDSPLWVLMLQGFLLGLASILTPCIFPMIPLTVTIFTKRYTTKAKGIRDALFYGLSIIGIYTGLTVILAMIFGPAILQIISNNPYFNIFFFVLLFAFALSFLGMFEIMLPSSWSTAASKRGDKGGLMGIFFMALALVIVSFSCTGPLVGTVLTLASNGTSFFTPIMTMLAFSIAMALPFMLLAIFPGWLDSLPRSGGWLNSVKVVLGLLELALAFIYLSRADLVMHWGLLDREIFIGAWVVIFSILGMYLLGKIRLPNDSPVDKVSVPRLLMAMGSFWFVLYLIPGLWGASLPMFGGFIPTNTKSIGVILQDGLVAGGLGTSPSSDICNYPDKISGHLSGDTPRGYCAFYDLKQGLEYAKKVNKPVFLDFTGHTCANCRYLEKTAWQDEQVKRMITQDYVLISLYTDDRKKLPEVLKTAKGKKLRTVGDKWLQHQINTYGTNAQPYYVLLDHEANVLVTPTGFNPPLDVQIYRDFFSRGLEEFRKK